jgi:hypothetical protein
MTKARDAGVKRFRAEILPDNDAARRFFAGLAPATRERLAGSNVVVTVDLEDALTSS